jgi:hypothetical protein
MPLSCLWTLLCNKAKRWKGWSFKLSRSQVPN